MIDIIVICNDEDLCFEICFDDVFVGFVVFDLCFGFICFFYIEIDLVF